MEHPNPWMVAIRPHTLPASASPVLIGGALALRNGCFSPLPFTAALVGALLLQVGTNLANDYYDARSGVDRYRQGGFTRVTASGLLPARRVHAAMWVSFLSAAVVPGLYLVYIGGVPLLVVGVAAVVAGITYSGGPLPYGSRALGDLMVFLFFGVIAVAGTYYVQKIVRDGLFFMVEVPIHVVPREVFATSLAPACLTTAILVVNNIRDLPTDREAGKTTLAVLLGYRGSRVEYLVLLLVAYALPVWLRIGMDFSWGVFLPWLTLPWAGILTRGVWNSRDPDVLNRTLSGTGRLLFFHSVLLSLGMNL